MVPDVTRLFNFFKASPHRTFKKTVDKIKFEYYIETGTKAGFMCYTIFCPFITLIFLFGNNLVSAGRNNYRKVS